MVEVDPGLMEEHRYIDLLQLTESGWRIYNKTLVVTVRAS